MPLDGPREELTGSVLKAANIMIPLVVLVVTPGSVDLLVTSQGMLRVEGTALSEQTAVGTDIPGVHRVGEGQSVVRRHGHYVANLWREIDRSGR